MKTKHGTNGSDSVNLVHLNQRDYPERLKLVTFGQTHVTFAMATRPQFPQQWLGATPNGN
jgi:hypothetical protein